MFLAMNFNALIVTSLAATCCLLKLSRITLAFKNVDGSFVLIGNLKLLIVFSSAMLECCCKVVS